MIRQIKQPTFQPSQISTIKKRNSLTSQINSNRDQSFFKLSRSPNYQQQKQSNYQSRQIKNLLTDNKPHQDQIQEESSLFHQNLIPVTYTNKDIKNQRRLNSSSKKVWQNSLCISTINVTDSNFAIQAQPNQMYVSFSTYFEDGSSGDDMKKDNNKQLSEQQKYGSMKIFKFLVKFNHILYIKKLALSKIKQHLFKCNQQFLQSLSKRQPQYIDQLLQSSTLESKYHHNKIYSKFNILYNNKMVGLCAPGLVQMTRLKIIERNLEQFKKEKQLENGIEKSYYKRSSNNSHSKSMSRPFDNLNENQNQNEQLQQQPQISNTGSKFYNNNTNTNINTNNMTNSPITNGFTFNFEIHPQPTTKFASRLKVNEYSPIKRNQ